MIRRCKSCGTPLPDEPAGKTGRRQTYCGPSCRQSAWRARRHTSAPAMIEELRALARRAEALARLAGECPDRFVGTFVAEEASWAAKRLSGAAGMIDPEPLPFDQSGGPCQTQNESDTPAKTSTARASASS